MPINIETINEKDEAIAPSFRFMMLHPAHFIALGFGSGLSPIMPGTMGTLFGWFLYFVLTHLWPEIFSPMAWLVMIFLGFIVGIWACDLTGSDLGKPDHGAMVWDEMIAIWLVLVFVTPAGWVMQGVAFVIFRMFDMLKPPPIRYFDENFKGGFGVMWDDIVAAFLSLLVLALWRVNFT